MIAHLKTYWRYLPKILFFIVVVKPLVLLLLGLNIRGRKQLPVRGPAILAANHNSHLDTLVLMSLYPISQIHRLRPVAAADYFFKNRYLTWFSTHVIGIIGLQRQGFQRPDELFAECYQALDNQDILIIFPEGSRGYPERMGQLKKGLYYLYRHSTTPMQVNPVMLRGLGKALPRGEALFVPFNCDVIIGERLANMDHAEDFIRQLEVAYDLLAKECLTK